MCAIRAFEPGNRRDDWFTALRRAVSEPQRPTKVAENRHGREIVIAYPAAFPLSTSATGAVAIAAAQPATIGPADAQGGHVGSLR